MKKIFLIMFTITSVSFATMCIDITSQDDACRDLFVAKHGGTPNQLCAETLTVATGGGSNQDGIGRDGAIYQCAVYFKTWRNCGSKSDILPTILGGVNP